MNIKTLALAAALLLSTTARAQWGGNWGGGGGGGTVSGSGTATYCAFWSASTTLSADSDCTFVTDTLTATKLATTKATITGGSLGDGINAFTASGTLNSASGVQAGLNADITTAGSTSGMLPIGAYIKLIAGYTGSSSTDGAFIQNAVAGTGSSPSNFGAGNYGAQMVSAATTAGTNFGGGGAAFGGDLNVGLLGYAITGKDNATNVGGFDTAVNGNTGGKRIGRFAVLTTGDNAFGYLPSASFALGASNGTTTDDIFRLYDETTLTFSVADGGNVTSTGSVLGAASTGGGTSKYWRVARTVASTVDTKPTCDSTAEGGIIYLNDSDDGVAAQACMCGRFDADDTTYAWKKMTDFTTACGL